METFERNNLSEDLLLSQWKVGEMMAWVSIHEGVVGPKLRLLAREVGCSQAEALGILDILWLWGLNNADKRGEIKYAVHQDIVAAIPNGMLSEGLKSEAVVDALLKSGWLDERDGKFYIHDWDLWQEQWYKALERRDYNAKRQRVYREGADAKKPEANEAPVVREDIEQPAPTPPKKPKKPKAEKPQVVKKTYAEHITLQEVEYEKLVAKYGKVATGKFIETLDHYKGSTGKAYKSDYHTILNWVVDRVSNDNPGLVRLNEEMKTGENPFARSQEGMT